ncbi:hypothetical protein COEREDRAFT_10233 [Coemansia reversa NRRL 1564]|uniref:Uncharacterized protein n=1 Tax=Coemansia reversa (strain ATCC 12441 / NRRL 1564) TaxID=763665 RepID=A0A2G5B694_COERN|nr:hypothetical protein COEREDRAFT_10233 [Coemansia reversa NRRL 1564]|eukprot:PIA14512.1 hypothetical protein COEREDRAFT_10233 [Coemansia reversa NRRL 1564]
MHKLIKQLGGRLSDMAPEVLTPSTNNSLTTAESPENTTWNMRNMQYMPNPQSIPTTRPIPTMQSIPTTLTTWTTWSRLPTSIPGTGAFLLPEESSTNAPPRV